ncbi:MAG TPA: pyridoxamine 5'-phosphate oxidase [Chloroflexi bacterium]|jgi:general stress protein 26|nr:pyridoxamine 5'-phosphate oxidase [Chloroflexota bacterium]HAL27680.1 pyridoxamine 5'-phosphate oxidase [Chloroflexota bacterium]
MSAAVSPVDFAAVFGVPAEVGAVVREFRSCEFSTLARDGTPVTWPTMPFFEPDWRRFLITSSIGLAQKAVNIRRDPRVAMLFSNPTGSGLVSPPFVLIQGDAEAPEELGQLDERFESMTRLLFERQPFGITLMGALPGPLRHLADWYCWRILVYVRPRRIRWWPQGNFGRAYGEVVL